MVLPVVVTALTAELLVIVQGKADRAVTTTHRVTREAAELPPMADSTFLAAWSVDYLG